MLALSGIAALADVAKCNAAASEAGAANPASALNPAALKPAVLNPAALAAALDEYMRFLDGTKSAGRAAAAATAATAAKRIMSVEKSGDTLASNGLTEQASRGGYVRKTLDSADLTRLGAEGVAQWLAGSEARPESLSEMWFRRFGNFVVGGMIGPLVFVLESRDMIASGAGMRRFRPSMFEGVCSCIQGRNEKARKRNAV